MDSFYNSPSLSPEPTTKQQLPQPKRSSASGDRRPLKLGNRAAEPENLPCPRCNSTNTKFCYYNNYNLSQPRHFCKSCRRYWTRGGALRDVPVGGGTRKAAASSSSNKRHRPATSTSSNDNDAMYQTRPRAIDPVVGQDVSVVDLNEAAVATSENALSSWWNGQTGTGGGLFPLNGYGLGLGESMGYEVGVLEWSMSMEQVGGGSDAMNGQSPCCNTWQMTGGADGGMAEGDYFSWPELAMSLPATKL